MKKHILLVSTLAIGLMSAQKNEDLMRMFEKQKLENNEKFDSYISKRYGTSRNNEITKEIEKQRSKLAGFTPDGKPYFNEENDLDQNKNSNADYLQNGTITGLTGSFNGENIKYTIFDGGRAFGGHLFFNNAPNRVNNKEASTMNYSAHATAVTSFIGAKDYPYTLTFTNGTTRVTNFRGIAQNATFDNYTFGTTTLPGNTSTSNVFQKILLAQPKISNHSYGTNPGWNYDEVNGTAVWMWNGAFVSPSTSYDLQGAYLTSDQNYDDIVYSNPSYVIVKSAGNSYGMGPTGDTMPKYYTDDNDNPVQFAATDVIPQNNCAMGYDCIGTGSLAKNIIIVGASNILTATDKRYATASDVIKSDYSSAGPRDDGAVKPDIITTGTNVAHASTAENTTGSNLIDVGSGTSYSGPIVTGIIGVWMQVYKQLNPGMELNAASAKTLMVHSASEAGTVGPDPWNGWGYINSKKGAELLVAKSNNTIIFNNETLNSGTPNKKNVIASGSEPLKVTVSWIDPAYVVPQNLTYAQAHNNRTSRLINDLDVRIIDTTDNTVYYPWKLNANSPMTPATKGDNIVDNVEQVVIETPTAGRTYKIEISNKGNLVDNTGMSAPQNYAIMVTGYTQEILGTANTVKNDFIIAPTITKDFVKILKAPKKSTFNIYELSGKKLQDGIINSDETSLDLSSYVKGIYIIEVRTGKDIISKKVIKE
ncbi:Por secretion system C-terminal sorting domain-containing protein [Chryseobacterium sp. RU37D]|uniref:S8 family peptidase n=1 Tax=Chryseobacterium sp. RU37D TaxID=1907397 RepID=UPI0009540DA4|nr:S8 family peptidase [Chryseobacterium sp. RU37D]SIQ49049.1 Por secretion system C-terminal sorting domain-containing protein [Chryseobacterium sp. RU37D]